LVALYRTFKEVMNAEVLADLLGVDVLALERECGVARDDEGVGVILRYGGNEVLCNGVGKIVLAWIVGEVGKGENSK
jgi:hypothetical protein